ncbi:hypothetical protein [Hoyosella altamirensis]|uniref:Bacteriocin biosynthesis cyclodehydratase domain-containing protein n=1 Tax=Hoyosella altamirensis TaxID=616997 RepID=A0A839RG48_9ACTN|nr:hypothetical protein [Hoyosella altamirensis]MBB3035692.1 bacteriocin biosynthesis cyclodehydratase domain-containing protein [Hoyosella altamirensis]
MTHDNQSPWTADTNGRQNPVVDRNRPVLVRPCGDVQIGWDPETALLISPPPGCSADALARILRSLDGTMAIDAAVRAGERAGASRTSFLTLLSHLRDVGVLAGAGHTTAPEAAAVALAGRGPLADVLAGALPELGVQVTKFTTPNQQRSQECIARTRPLLVVLTDSALVSPVLNDFLIREQLPHLAVRVRDGRGLIGPLVLPGATSCLRCADLYRTDRDPEWPHIAAQLTGSVTHASPATIHAAAGYALSQVELVLAAARRPNDPGPLGPPATLGATVEIDPLTVTMTTRDWPRHPLCSCWTGEPGGAGDSAA